MHEQSLKGIARKSPTGRWRKRAQWAQHKLEALPAAIWVIMISIAALVVFSVTNVVYQVLRKPTEVFAPISNGFNKAPSETWRQYAPLFREYSTASISPELLAALAQVESAGNPLVTSYWRWRLPGSRFRSTSLPQVLSACTRRLGMPEFVPTICLGVHSTFYSDEISF